MRLILSIIVTWVIVFVVTLTIWALVVFAFDYLL